MMIVPNRNQIAEVLYRDDQHEDYLWSEETNSATRDAYLKNADAVVAFLRDWKPTAQFVTLEEHDGAAQRFPAGRPSERKKSDR